MKKLLIIAILLPLFFACKTDCIEDSGNHIQHSSTVKPFDKIEVSGGMILVLKQDSSYGIKVATDSNLIQQVKVDVGGSKLTVKMKDGQYCGKDSVVIEAGIGQLKELNVAGSVKVRTDGRIYTDQLKLNASGSSDITLDLNAASLSSALDGVTTLRLSGQAGVHSFNVQGNADIKAFDFTAGTYNIGIAGSAKADINVLNELNVKTEGSSEIHYKGNPQKVNEQKSGAAKLEKVK
jgi:hypothetical protein